MAIFNNWLKIPNKINDFYSQAGIGQSIALLDKGPSTWILTGGRKDQKEALELSLNADIGFCLWTLGRILPLDIGVEGKPYS